MNFRGLQIVIFCYSCIPTALGKGDGAPESACDSMTPSHSGYTFQDPKTLPYSISVEPGCSTGELPIYFKITVLNTCLKNK